MVLDFASMKSGRMILAPHSEGNHTNENNDSQHNDTIHTDQTPDHKETEKETSGGIRGNNFPELAPKRCRKGFQGADPHVAQVLRNI
jgi:hypothetical protein